MALHPHIFVPAGADPIAFTSPNSGPRDKFVRPPRNRAQHAADLVEKLVTVSQENDARVEEQTDLGITDAQGIYVSFLSAPNFDLRFESLDLARSGVELCTVKTTSDNRQLATVFVPDGKLSLFINRVESYRDEMTKPRKEDGPTRPKHQDLVESISDIRLAALEALWTEPEMAFPNTAHPINWELWLRTDGKVNQLERLREHAQQFDLTVGNQVIGFVDRTIVIVRATAANLSRSVDILGMIAELRIPRTTAGYFAGLPSIEQQAWLDNLTGRLQPAPAEAPYVCILDSGINHLHPLLTASLSPADLHTQKPAWGTNDSMAHGTPMAGLSLLGDLTDVLQTAGPVQVSHRLESVKIINPADPNELELYGAVSREAAYRVEINGERNRVFCMAVTAPDGRDRGRPSSWSSALDSLASGAGDEDEQRRLIIVAAGNADEAAHRDYPDSNFTDGIHDPAQAWNALAIGGYTEKVAIDAAQYPGWQPLAMAGDLSPSSCTSVTWGKWPLKPDIVMEAGNMGRNEQFDDPDYIDNGLQLLSTAHDFAFNRPFKVFGDTSAAAALASRYAALAWAKYPELRPETVRALMVHSAEWTPAMIGRFRQANGTIDHRSLLRCFGRGTPNPTRLLSSLDNSLTLVVESEIQPFFKDDEDNRVKTREMRLHPLPWPTDVLDDLGDTQVVMRVTLSYFIEPSPGERGWTARYGYPSHGLRFAVINPLESEAAFQQRINKAGRDEDYEAQSLGDPGWDFGRAQRSLTSLGSLHSDVWRGTAAALASRRHVAIYPTMGWWNKRPQLEGWRKAARYSLIVTIETPGVEAELYASVAAQIGVPVVIEV